MPTWLSPIRKTFRALGFGAVVLAAAWTAPQVSSRGTTVPVVSLKQVLAALQTSAAGRGLLDRAVERWQLKTQADVQTYLRWGVVSKTDAVLTRHFDPETGKEERTRQVLIYLRKDLSLQDAVLDLAHEMVHATETPLWDPYDPELTPTRYIQAAIEGRGGEVSAVLQECEVARDFLRVTRERAQRLAGAAAKASIAERCVRYYDAKADVVSRERVLKDFYSVGKWKGRLQEQLGRAKHELPLLSEAEPVLFSSTGRTPYPVALYEEFEQMNEVACRNSRRRHESADRAPASLGTGLNENARFLQRRCSKAEA